MAWLGQYRVRLRAGKAWHPQEWRPRGRYSTGAMSSDFDVVVIGSGPAGEKAAMQAAKLRRRVAVVERPGRLGGNCLHTATIPSKTLRETILYVAGVKQRSLYGIQTTLRKDLTVNDRVPRTLTIVGAGVIGCEYACMFAMLGTKVTLVDARCRVLDFADAEIAELLVARMREHGITLRLGEEVAEVRRETPDRIVAETRSGKAVVGEKLLYAVGREGNTAELALERAGLRAGRRGLIEVNAHFQTAVPHVYAVGDVIGFPSLAATSMHQGRLAMAHAFGLPVNGEGTRLPYGIFTIPEISMVGETEEQLTRARVPYEVGQAFF